MVVVRNKKRVGYTYELTLKVKGKSSSTIFVQNPIVNFYSAFQSTWPFMCHANLQMEAGEWNMRGEKKSVAGHIDVPEFSFGELDDLQVLVNIDLNTFEAQINCKELTHMSIF